MAAARIPYLLGHTEIASLFGVERQTSQKWRVDGTLTEPDLVASGNPYWLLDTVLRLGGRASRQATKQRLEQYLARVPGGYLITDPEALPVIVGIQEVAQLLGTSQQTVSRWRNRKQIAEADLVLSRSPLWLLDSILADAHSRGRALLQEEVERLRSGERAPQKPRGRRATGTRSGRKRPPAAQSFTSSERDEAVAFVAEVLSEGHTAVIRPKR
ncbi:hypothetical protein ACFCXA_13920 [Streptomyces virginiae]|uniref:hypothetical protein n=1 Tax=Streptomyces virginiae TaxID=1961 RepID=UPI0035D9DA4A